jgi:hypothetical protein
VRPCCTPSNHAEVAQRVVARSGRRPPSDVIAWCTRVIIHSSGGMMASPGRFCESCGTALPDGARFCETCGQPVDEGSSASATPAPAVPAPAIPAPAVPASAQACRSCGQDDQVVTAAAYTPEADPQVAGDEDRADPEMVALFLQRPDAPATSGVRGWALAAFIPTAVFFIYWLAPIQRGFRFFLLGWTVAFWMSVLVPSLRAMELYAFIGLFHLLFYWIALFVGRNRHKADLLTKRIPAYHTKLARWERLRYCRRCQRAWLDNASGVPVGITEIDALLQG